MPIRGTTVCCRGGAGLRGRARAGGVHLAGPERRPPNRGGLAGRDRAGDGPRRGLAGTCTRGRCLTCCRTGLCRCAVLCQVLPGGGVSRCDASPDGVVPRCTEPHHVPSDEAPLHCAPSHHVLPGRVVLCHIPWCLRPLLQAPSRRVVLYPSLAPLRPVAPRSAGSGRASPHPFVPPLAASGPVTPRGCVPSPAPPRLAAPRPAGLGRASPDPPRPRPLPQSPSHRVAPPPAPPHHAPPLDSPPPALRRNGSAHG